MLDLRDFAIWDVRLERNLRRRRNRSWDSSSRYCGIAGNVDLFGNDDIIGDVSDVGNVNNLRHAANFGHVGNVRLGFKRHRLFFESDLNVTDRARWRRSNRNPVGVYRDRQPWGQFRGCRTNDGRFTHCGHRGASANDAHRYISAHPFISNDKHRFREHSSGAQSERINTSADGCRLMTKEPSLTIRTTGAAIIPRG